MIKVYTVIDGKLHCRLSDKTLAPEQAYTKEQIKVIGERLSESEKQDVRDICRAFKGRIC